MKKLLVLLMVLGMASLANAGLVLDLSGTPVTDGLKVASDGTLVLSATMEGGEVQYTVLVEAAGPDLSLDYAATEFPGAGTAWVLGNGFSPPAPTASAVTLSAGTLAFAPAAAGAGAFDGLIVNGQDGMLTITEFFSNADPIVSEVTVTPEPMTMSLLGLGGLALIRRRRNA